MAYEKLKPTPPATTATFATNHAKRSNLATVAGPAAPQSETNSSKVAVVAAGDRSQNEDDAFEERAAICEHDGGLSREHTECLASLHTVHPKGVTPEQLGVVIDAAARFLDRKLIPATGRKAG